MKTQTFGIEIEMNRITRAAAAQVLADHFGTRVQHTGGTYDTRLVPDAQGRDWKIVSDNSIEGPQEERTEFVSPSAAGKTSKRSRSWSGSSRPRAAGRTAAAGSTCTSAAASTRLGLCGSWSTRSMPRRIC